MSKLIAETEFAAIDFESAGMEAGGTDLPIQIGMACMKRGVLMPETFFRSYLQMAHTGNQLAVTIHRVRLEQLVDAPSLLSIWPVVQRHLQNRCVVAHGVGSEKRYLRAFPFHGFGPWVDTLKLTRVLHPGLSDYSLGALLATFGMQEEVNRFCVGLKWHDALYDAVACLLLLRSLVKSADLWLKPISILENPRQLPADSGKGRRYKSI